MSLKFPDFFVVGAPKCGTTALFSYLGDHPAIFTPAVKEPMYFCPDFPYDKAIRNEKEYLELFAPAPTHAMTGEASVLYLLSEVALGRILSANPAAKIIVMLRNPIEAARSRHLHNLRMLDENIEDFESAWHAQRERALGQRVPARCAFPVLLQYGPVYSYAKQIARMMQIVPPAQRHFIIYEEFFGDLARHYAETLVFLGVDLDGRTNFPIVYPAMRNRSRALASFLIHPPGIAKRVWAPFRKIAISLRIHPGELVNRHNSQAISKKPLNIDFRAELSRYFAEDIAETEALLDRKLDIWR